MGYLTILKHSGFTFLQRMELALGKYTGSIKTIGGAI